MFLELCSNNRRQVPPVSPTTSKGMLSTTMRGSTPSFTVANAIATNMKPISTTHKSEGKRVVKAKKTVRFAFALPRRRSLRSKSPITTTEETDAGDSITTTSNSMSCPTPTPPPPATATESTSWYDNNDYFRMAMEQQETVDAFNEVDHQAECLNPEEYCLRGLENQIFPQIGVQSQDNIWEAVHSVLEHQRLYFELGGGVFLQDQIAKTIANVARIHSLSSVNKALVLAAVDAAAVQRALAREKEEQQAQEEQEEASNQDNDQDHPVASPIDDAAAPTME